MKRFQVLIFLTVIALIGSGCENSVKEFVRSEGKKEGPREEPSLQPATPSVVPEGVAQVSGGGKNLSGIQVTTKTNTNHSNQILSGSRVKSIVSIGQTKIQ